MCDLCVEKEDKLVELQQQSPVLCNTYHSRTDKEQLASNLALDETGELKCFHKVV